MSDIKFLRISPTCFVAHGHQDINSFQSVSFEEFRETIYTCGLKSNWGVWVEAGYIHPDDRVTIFDLHQWVPANRLGQSATGEEIFNSLPALPYEITFTNKQVNDQPGRAGNVFFEIVGNGVYQLHNKENYFNQFIDEYSFNELIPEHLKKDGLFLYFDSDNGIESGLVLATKPPFSRGGSFAEINHKFKHVGEVVDYITNNSFLSDWLNDRSKPVKETAPLSDENQDVVQLYEEEQIVYTIDEVNNIISFLRPDLDLESPLVKKLLSK
ncbi:hypothetical protein [Aeromonas phage AerS_266]|nr:hypothetical protein [Aeromonas phage AerS_266]